MPALAPIVLNDGTNDHTFTPSSGTDANGTSVLVESTGVPLGNSRLLVTRSRTTQGREKVALKLTIPVVQNSSEAGISRPTVVRAAYADVTLSFDGGSSTAERHAVRMMLGDLITDAVMADVVDDLENLY